MKEEGDRVRGLGRRRGEGRKEGEGGKGRGRESKGKKGKGKGREGRIKRSKEERRVGRGRKGRKGEEEGGKKGGERRGEREREGGKEERELERREKGRGNERERKGEGGRGRGEREGKGRKLEGRVEGRREEREEKEKRGEKRKEGKREKEEGEKRKEGRGKKGQKEGEKLRREEGRRSKEKEEEREGGRKGERRRRERRRKEKEEGGGGEGRKGKREEERRREKKEGRGEEGEGEGERVVEGGKSREDRVKRRGGRGGSREKEEGKGKGKGRSQRRGEERREERGGRGRGREGTEGETRGVRRRLYKSAPGWPRGGGGAGRVWRSARTSALFLCVPRWSVRCAARTTGGAGRPAGCAWPLVLTLVRPAAIRPRRFGAPRVASASVCALGLRPCGRGGGRGGRPARRPPIVTRLGPAVRWLVVSLNVAARPGAARPRPGLFPLVALGAAGTGGLGSDREPAPAGSCRLRFACGAPPGAGALLRVVVPAGGSAGCRGSSDSPVPPAASAAPWSASVAPCPRCPPSGRRAAPVGDGPRVSGASLGPRGVAAGVVAVASSSSPSARLRRRLGAFARPSTGSPLRWAGLRAWPGARRRGSGGAVRPHFFCLGPSRVPAFSRCSPWCPRVYAAPPPPALLSPRARALVRRPRAESPGLGPACAARTGLRVLTGVAVARALSLLWKRQSPRWAAVVLVRSLMFATLDARSASNVLGPRRSTLLLRSSVPLRLFSRFFVGLVSALAVPRWARPLLVGACFRRLLVSRGPSWSRLVGRLGVVLCGRARWESPCSGLPGSRGVRPPPSVECSVSAGVAVRFGRHGLCHSNRTLLRVGPGRAPGGATLTDSAWRRRNASPGVLAARGVRSVWWLASPARSRRPGAGASLSVGASVPRGRAPSPWGCVPRRRGRPSAPGRPLLFGLGRSLIPCRAGAVATVVTPSASRLPHSAPVFVDLSWSPPGSVCGAGRHGVPELAGPAPAVTCFRSFQVRCQPGGAFCERCLFSALVNGLASACLSSGCFLRVPSPWSWVAGARAAGWRAAGRGGRGAPLGYGPSPVGPPRAVARVPFRSLCFARLHASRSRPGRGRRSCRVAPGRPCCRAFSVVGRGGSARLGSRPRPRRPPTLSLSVRAPVRRAAVPCKTGCCFRAASVLFFPLAPRRFVCGAHYFRCARAAGDLRPWLCSGGPGPCRRRCAVRLHGRLVRATWPSLGRSVRYATLWVSGNPRGWRTVLSPALAVAGRGCRVWFGTSAPPARVTASGALLPAARVSVAGACAVLYVNALPSAQCGAVRASACPAVVWGLVPGRRGCVPLPLVWGAGASAAGYGGAPSSGWLCLPCVLAAASLLAPARVCRHSTRVSGLCRLAVLSVVALSPPGLWAGLRLLCGTGLYSRDRVPTVVSPAPEPAVALGRAPPCVAVTLRPRAPGSGARARRAACGPLPPVLGPPPRWWLPAPVVGLSCSTLLGGATGRAAASWARGAAGRCRSGSLGRLASALCWARRAPPDSRLRTSVCLRSGLPLPSSVGAGTGSPVPLNGALALDGLCVFLPSMPPAQSGPWPCPPLRSSPGRRFPGVTWRAMACRSRGAGTGLCRGAAGWAGRRVPVVCCELARSLDRTRPAAGVLVRGAASSLRLVGVPCSLSSLTFPRCSPGGGTALPAVATGPVGPLPCFSPLRGRVRRCRRGRATRLRPSAVCAWLPWHVCASAGVRTSPRARALLTVAPGVGAPGRFRRRGPGPWRGGAFSWLRVCRWRRVRRRRRPSSGGAWLVVSRVLRSARRLLLLCRVAPWRGLRAERPPRPGGNPRWPPGLCACLENLLRETRQPGLRRFAARWRLGAPLGAAVLLMRVTPGGAAPPVWGPCVLPPCVAGAPAWAGRAAAAHRPPGGLTCDALPWVLRRCRFAGLCLSGGAGGSVLRDAGAPAPRTRLLCAGVSAGSVLCAAGRPWAAGPGLPPPGPGPAGAPRAVGVGRFVCPRPLDRPCRRSPSCAPVCAARSWARGPGNPARCCPGRPALACWTLALLVSVPPPSDAPGVLGSVVCLLSCPAVGAGLASWSGNAAGAGASATLGGARAGASLFASWSCCGWLP
ncbi:hypothetical protein Tco_0088654 [Tanacetum coccineum]